MGESPDLVLPVCLPLPDGLCWVHCAPHRVFGPAVLDCGRACRSRESQLCLPVWRSPRPGEQNRTNPEASNPYIGFNKSLTLLKLH